ncbi:MAG TPA: 3-deoxy-8-phosphooctulonate synthase [Fimbriimonadales bacterium]|jgi:2-dehydro-3-deoxyphosphooctonate aldolase (KDO 8-P synthase)|nr:3-deoxy-8-phosphooctulonate synthase [Fimbriimonadales bacterium]
MSVGSVKIGDGHPALIAGPCVAESIDLCRQVADKMQRICATLSVQFIFKASFDKANRTGSGSPRGKGIDEGLSILQEIRSEFGVPVTTDVHLPDQAAVVSRSVDLLQVPAFLCRQTDLLEACAATGLPVNVKKGQFLAPWDSKNIVDKLSDMKAEGIMLTERGSSFGYNNLVVDMAGLPVMRSFGVPVCFDATHSAQRPGAGGTQSGGARDSIPYLACAAAAAGIDALFMEVHPDPERALSDAATQWPLDKAEKLVRKVMRIWKAASGE